VISYFLYSVSSATKPRVAERGGSTTVVLLIIIVILLFIFLRVFYNFRNENTELQLKLEKEQGEINELIKKNEELTNDISAAVEDKNKIYEDLEKEQMKNQQLTVQLAEKKDKMEESPNEQKLKDQINEKAQKIERLTFQINEKEQTIQGLTDRINKNVLCNFSEENTKKRKEATNATFELEALRKEIAELRKELTREHIIKITGEELLKFIIENKNRKSIDEKKYSPEELVEFLHTILKIMDTEIIKKAVVKRYKEIKSNAEKARRKNIKLEELSDKFYHYICWEENCSQSLLCKRCHKKDCSKGLPCSTTGCGRISLCQKCEKKDDNNRFPCYVQDCGQSLLCERCQAKDCSQSLLCESCHEKDCSKGLPCGTTGCSQSSLCKRCHEKKCNRDLSAKMIKEKNYDLLCKTCNKIKETRESELQMLRFLSTDQQKKMFELCVEDIYSQHRKLKKELEKELDKKTKECASLWKIAQEAQSNTLNNQQ
jgi:hypothetical protein